MSNIIQNISNIFDIKLIQIEALNRYYAALVLNYFRSQQPPGIGTKGKYWSNQTGQAATRVFSDIFKEANKLGFFISHGVNYGVYLELANDRKYESLYPIIKKFSGRYFQDVRRILQA
jgi:hypothetical protein